MSEKIITNLHPISFESEIKHVNGEYTVAGLLNTDGKKNLSYVNGSVSKSGMSVGSFDARRDGENIRINYNNVPMDETEAVTGVVMETVNGILEELNEE